MYSFIFIPTMLWEICCQSFTYTVCSQLFLAVVDDPFFLNVFLGFLRESTFQTEILYRLIVHTDFLDTIGGWQRFNKGMIDLSPNVCMQAITMIIVERMGINVSLHYLQWM
jgi:hypothetical protein